MTEDNASEFDPFTNVFDAHGVVETEVVGRRLPTLIALLREHEACFPIRVDVDALTAALTSGPGRAIREAENPDAIEAAVREFSLQHLHALVTEEQVTAAQRALQGIADDAEESRKRREAAAAGVALTGDLPDSHGLRGRGLFDLALRVTLEELHAQQELRRAAAENDGLSAEELDRFWEQYPALRHHYETRYRAEVEAVLAAIDADRLPSVISVDLALRGAHRLLAAVAERRARGEELVADEVGDLLQEAFDSDLLDGGRGLVAGRWRTIASSLQRLSSSMEDDSEDEKQAAEMLADVERALRIIAPGSPAGDMVLLHAYVRAVVDGNFHVRDPQEGEAARAIFTDDGLDANGVLSFADFLAERGDVDHVHRVLLAGVELWPEHEGIRQAAVTAAEKRMEQARNVRQGPTYDEDGAEG